MPGKVGDQTMSGEGIVLELQVLEGLVEDVRKGVVRINREDMQQLGLEMGDIVSIQGERTTVAKVYPAFGEMYGQLIIQMDGVVRRNAGVGVRDPVKIKKVSCRKANQVVLTPLENFNSWSKEDEKQLKELLVGIPLITDDELSVILFGYQERGFRVLGTAPGGPVVVGPATEVRLTAPELAGSPRERVAYEDIGGLTREVQKIREIVELPVKYPQVFRRLGIEAPKGLLLYGPPGTGKTLIARAVASETKAHFIHVNGPEIMHKFYGESEAKLREVFEEARRNAPSILFLDEIDAIAPRRSEVHGEVEKRVVAQLLALMDGLESRGQVVIIGATNIPATIDPALRRPGRFDREIGISPPDSAGREQILYIHTRGMPLAKDVNLKGLARMTNGFVGADLAALCKEAGMATLRKILPALEGRQELPSFQVGMADFLEALGEVEPSATREYYAEIPDVSWEDVGGLQEVKTTLQTLIEIPVKDPERCREYNVEPPKGILLTGAPGTGKTLVAKAIGRSSSANFININGPTLLSRWMGESEKALHDLFIKAKQTAPCILFFDEIDGMVRTRSGAGNNQGERLISQLILEFDGIEKVAGVVVLAATNRPDLLDPALLRSGRFEYIVELPLPTEAEREEILAIHTEKLPLDPEVSLRDLAAMTKGFSGSDLVSLCRKCAFMAMKQETETGGGGNRITNSMFKAVLTGEFTHVRTS